MQERVHPVSDEITPNKPIIFGLMSSVFQFLTYGAIKGADYNLQNLPDLPKNLYIYSFAAVAVFFGYASARATFDYVQEIILKNAVEGRLD